MNKYLRTLIVLITIIIFVWIGFHYKKDKTFSSKTPAIAVQVLKVTPKPVAIYIDSFGTLVASKDVVIKAQVPGQLQKVCFKNGSNVRKGQTLLVIDSAPYKIKLKSDQALLEKSSAELNLKNVIFQRCHTLAKTGAIAKLDYEKMKTELRVAIAEVKQKEADILNDNLNIQYCTIKSPIDGIIGINQVDEGNIISTEDVLATVKNLDTLYIDFTVAENDISRINKALSLGKLKLTVYVENKTSGNINQQVKYDGELEYLNNTANIASGTISLRGIVPNRNISLLPGRFARIRLNIENRENALLIPQMAVRQGPDGQYVFVVDHNNKAKMISVVTGQEDGDSYVLEKGALDANSKIIVNKLLELYPGAPVTISN